MGNNLRSACDGILQNVVTGKDRVPGVVAMITDRSANIYEGAVATRGLTRTKTPEEVFGTPNVEEVWRLALRFQQYQGLFSHRAYALRRGRGATV